MGDVESLEWAMQTGSSDQNLGVVQVALLV